MINLTSLLECILDNTQLPHLNCNSRIFSEEKESRSEKRIFYKTVLSLGALKWVCPTNKECHHCQVTSIDLQKSGVPPTHSYTLFIVVAPPP